MKHTNKLINETSPYLLQHAHNPVDWYPWGEEALQLAKSSDRPILVSIGYSACHWCHVMERESFENESVAKLMNECFINIKIDREERPDLDHIYMDAVQNMTGSGGWPLNVFLTPSGKPFYGGTYFPPSRAFNRASWPEVLQAVHHAYINKKEEVIAQADNLTAHLANSNGFGIGKQAVENELFTPDNLQQMADNALKSADAVWGGFGGAPKFPQTFTIQYLLRHYHFTKHRPSLDQALLSLDKMMAGGIYDHLAGGFARYSTNAKWLAPHFEKMLYDNALLINVISEAFLLTKKPGYAEVIEHTLEFIGREMQSPEGGFYSALDADSEGVEGKYYVWGKKEVDEILGEDSPLFCSVYDISDIGNWEHNNIIWLLKPLESFIFELNFNEKNIKERLKKCRQKLLSARQLRIRPGLDDKILLGWNALIISAFCKAFSALGKNEYVKKAEDCLCFLEAKLNGGSWSHTYKNGQAKYPAFLDDLACLIQAYINLQEVTGNASYLLKARQLAQYVIGAFSDEEGLLFYFTPSGQPDIIVRKKEVYDGATPSGNAVMAHNLYYLAIIFNIPAWRKRALAMLASLGQTVIKYPSSFAVWGSLMQNIVHGVNEIAVVGGNYKTLLTGVLNLYLPNKVLQSAPVADTQFPLLANREKPAGTWIYFCSGYFCSQPVETVDQLQLLL